LSISPYDQEIGIAPLREKPKPTTTALPTTLPLTTRLPSNKQRYTKYGDGEASKSSKIQVGQVFLTSLLLSVVRLVI
jgi:hypothetical protein